MADRNPHATRDEPCIEVKLAPTNETVGYLTPKISARHKSTISAVLGSGKQPTAQGFVDKGTKGGTEIWRIKAMFSP